MANPDRATEAAFRAAFAHSPAKADPTVHSEASADTVSRRFLKLLGCARPDILLFSPCFIPGSDTIDELRRVREAGVRVRGVTNSLAVSAEPLINIGHLHHRRQLLTMGVELYELSSTRSSATAQCANCSAARSGVCTPGWGFWTSARCWSVR